MDRLVDGALGGFDDLLDSRMAAADDEHDAFGRVDRQRAPSLQGQRPVPFSRIRWKPGATSMVLVTQVKFPSGHGVPKRSVSGALPS